MQRHAAGTVKPRRWLAAGPHRTMDVPARRRGAALRRADARAIPEGVSVVMDIIYIEALRIEAFIGIYEWERQVRQTVVLDLEMAADCRRAAASDAIEDTVNYKAVAKRVKAFIDDNRFDLVETLAERVAEVVLGEFRVPWLRLRVNKEGALRGARGVGVVIERGERIERG